MTNSQSRVRFWKILVILFLCIVAIGVGSWLWIDSVARRSWRDMNRRVEEIRQEAQARTPARHVLRGEPLPGDAWGDYKAALDEAHKVRGSQVRLKLLVLGDPIIDRAEAKLLVDSGIAAVERLRRGARRVELGLLPRHIYQSNEVDIRTLGFLVVSKARLLREDGKPLEAVDLLVDYLQFMRDLWATASEWRAHTCTDLCFPLDDLQEMVVSGALSKKEYLELGAQLEKLDASLPSDLTGELRDIVKSTEQLISAPVTSKELREGGGTWLKTWRFAFSERLLKADAFKQMNHSVQVALSVEGKSYHHVYKAFQEMDAEDAEPFLRNPLSSTYNVVNIYAGVIERERLAQIRLVRIAAHFKATGEVLNLEDPLGDRFFHILAGNQLKAWSWAKGKPVFDLRPPALKPRPWDFLSIEVDR